MGNRRKNLLVIGIDQAIPYLLKKFIKEGLIPNIAQLAETGVMGEALPCAPCDTPTNWTTIATGATTAVHGATSFYMHLPGEPLNQGLELRSRTQLSRYCKAEYFWDVADRAGYIPFVTNYPGGWPRYFNKGAMSLFTWSIPESLPRMLERSSIYSFNLNSEDSSIHLVKIKENKNQNNSPLLQATIYLKTKEIRNQRLIEFYLFDSKGKGYDMVKFSTKDKGELEYLNINEWSDWIIRDLDTVFGILPCLFKLKALNLDPEGNSFKIQISSIYNTKGWATPESFGKKIVENVFKYDLPKKQKIEFMIYGNINKFLSSAKQESLTLANSIKFAHKELNWDVCFFHYHHIDSINHTTLAYLDKNSPIYTEKKEEKSWEYVKQIYLIVDELVENLVKSCVDENTVIIFISDHGAVPIWKIVDIPLAFAKAGLTKYKLDSRRKKYLIDWEKSVAFPYMEPPFIWINLKNRDPHGIVSQTEYEDVRNQVIETLENLKDPETNQSVIQSVFKREDAGDLGLDGERIGDLIYFLKPPYGIFDGSLNAINASSLSQNYFSKSIVNDSKKFFGAHAYYHPNAKLGDYTVSAPLIFNGPGIKKGIELNKIVNLTDIAPTLAYLLQIPKPAQSQGKIIGEILE